MFNLIRNYAQHSKTYSLHFDEVKLVEQGSDCNVAIKHCQAIK